jgi:hypothetical protein
LLLNHFLLMQRHVCFLLYPIVIFVDIVGDFKSFYGKKMLFSHLFRNIILKTGVLFFHINVPRECQILLQYSLRVGNQQSDIFTVNIKKVPKRYTFRFNWKCSRLRGKCKVCLG